MIEHYAIPHHPDGATVRLTTTPDSRGMYRIKFPDPGDGHTRDHRRADLDDARTLAIGLAAGLDPHALTDQVDAPHDTTTVDDLYHRWVDTHEDDWSPGHLTSLSSAWRLHISPLLGDTAVAAWGPADTRAVVQAASKTLAASTVGLLYDYMSALASWAYDQGKIGREQDPLRGVKRPKKVVKAQTMELPERDMVEALAAAYAERRGDDRYLLAVRACAYVGLRAGEMLALHGDRLDLARGIALIDRQVTNSSPGMVPPKNGKAREVVWPRFLDDDFAKIAEQADGGPLWPAAQSDGPERYGTMYHHLRAAQEAVGWPAGLRGAHSLRHWYGTWALTPPNKGLGLPIGHVSTNMGHHSAAFTMQQYVSRIGSVADAIRGAA